MKGLLIALAFLTRLPVPRTVTDAESFANSMRWFPLVGLLVGALIAAAAWAGAQIDPWIGALAALLTWVAITGALHLDGLADLVDATAAAHGNRDRLLVVLADPHIGAFGVIAIVLQLLTKLVLLHALVVAGLLPALALVPFAARIGPLAWTLWLPPLHQGLAARFHSTVRPLHLLLWALVLAASAIIAPTILFAPPLIACWDLFVRRVVGGISGDGHGAGIELVESALLATLLIMHSVVGA